MFLGPQWNKVLLLGTWVTFMWTQRLSGQTNQRGALDHRNPYERDRTRVIHCPAFRRLQRKTQILGTDEGDFHRTRLTHSLEVASIGTSIVRNLLQKNQDIPEKALLPNDDLMHVICLLHDIGHPPFGHGGEAALNYMMREHGGFESNAQTLRLLTKTENSYGPYGLDLTRRALLGILKYPVSYSNTVAKTIRKTQTTLNQTIRVNDWHPPKAYYDCEQPEVDWLLSPFSETDRTLLQSFKSPPTDTINGKSLYQSLDCSIMNVADDIAYGVHDLEDAIHLQLITRTDLDTDELKHLLQETPLNPQKTTLIDNLFSKNLSIRKEAIGELVNYFITATHFECTHEAFENPLLKTNIALTIEADALLNYLMKSIYSLVIDSQESRTFEYGGQTVILRLFDAISTNPSSLLDKKNRSLFQKAQEEESGAFRVVCDTIANMTDEYAYRMHERLFGLNTRTIFERL